MTIAERLVMTNPTASKSQAPRETLADIARALNAATPIALAPHYYRVTGGAK